MPYPSSHQKGSFVNLIWYDGCCCCCFKSRNPCPFLLFLWHSELPCYVCCVTRVDLTGLCVALHTTCDLHGLSKNASCAHGHRCPCGDRWRDQRVYVRVCALAPWFFKAQEKKKLASFQSVLKKVGNGEWDLRWETESTDWILFLLQSRSRA